MFTLAPESAAFTCHLFPVLLCSAQKLFLLLSAISQYFVYCYFFLYFPQFIQEMLILSARGLGEFISNQLETRYKELWLRVQCRLYYSQKGIKHYAG